MSVQHETDMPPWSLYVRCWVNSGKHLLSLSFSGFDPKRSLSVGAIGMLQLAQRLAEKLHNLARQLRLKGLAVEARGILRRGAEPGAKFRDRRRYERIVARARGEACSRGWKLLAQVFIVVLPRQRFVELGANQQHGRPRLLEGSRHERHAEWGQQHGRADARVGHAARGGHRGGQRQRRGAARRDAEVRVAKRAGGNLP